MSYSTSYPLWMANCTRLAGGLFLLLCLAGPLATPAVQSQSPVAPLLVQIVAPTSSQRTAMLQLGLDVIQADEAGLVAWVTPAQRASLAAAGYAYRLLPQPTFAPTVDPAYHYYQGAVTEMQSVAARYPAIAQLIVLGASEGNLPIYALNISDRPATDAPEAGVLIVALTHAREHLTVEMALFIIQFLTQEYGHNPAITNLVNERDIWIIPVLNPDGETFDVQSGYYQYWRKNRRLNANGSFGVDLNRNFGYRWGCCGGSSSQPSNPEYRGLAPFSERETTILRQFVEGRPHLTASLSLHSYAELVLWPFGYTDEALPADMDALDHQAFVAIGQEMARRNGYRAMQSSSLYVTDGSSDDWLYGVHGIFAFTVEMYPRYSDPGFYPSGDVIARETQRNRTAIEYFLGMADYPRKVAGVGGDTQAPQITLTEPANGARLSTPIRLRAAAQDNVGVTLVEFLADGRTIGLDAQPPFEMIWTPPAGPLTLQARAFDAGQNIGASPAVTVAVQMSLRLPLVERRAENWGGR